MENETSILTAEDHLDNTIDLLRSYFISSSDKIQSIELMNKIPATKLAEYVEEEFKLEASFYPTLLFLLKPNYPGVALKKGAHGGIHRIAEVDANVIEEHIEKSLLTIKTIYKKAIAKIDALEVGAKIAATKLGSELTEEFDLDGSFYPTLLFLTKANYPGIVVKKGAYGGIYKS